MTISALDKLAFGKENLFGRFGISVKFNYGDRLFGADYYAACLAGAAGTCSVLKIKRCAGFLAFKTQGASGAFSDACLAQSAFFRI